VRQDAVVTWIANPSTLISINSSKANMNEKDCIIFTIKIYAEKPEKSWAVFPNHFIMVSWSFRSSDRKILSNNLTV
jgi:hypothetical protein